MKITILGSALLSVLALIQGIRGKKILSVEFFGSKSHVITYLGLLEELSRRGNQVTLVAPIKNFAKAGVKEVFTLDAAKLFVDENYNAIEMKEKNMDLNPFVVMTKLYPKECATLYDRPDMKALMEESWDLVILQPMFNECALGFVHKVMQKNKCPLILFLPTTPPNFLVSRLGGYHPVSSVPSMFLALGAEMNFWERIQNMAMEVLITYMVDYKFTPAMESVYREKLGPDTPSAKEILGSASIMIANSHFSLSHPKPNYPDIIEVGGIHSHPAKPLPKDLEDFVAGSGNDGFIFFSFGSIIPMDTVSKEKLQIFLNVFSKLKQRIIWKYDGKDIKNLPTNIKLSKWLPQQDLLGHPKIKLFITHCGMGGTEEAIYHGVPMLGIPFLGDQPLNAAQAEKQGILNRIEWNELSEKNLANGINELINNPRYRENVKELSAVFKDQIDNPLDRAIWWTEYVMRHNGAPRIISSSRKLNFFQYHSLDVIAFFLSLLLSTVFIIFKVIKVLYRLVFGSKNRSNDKRKGKKD